MSDKESPRCPVCSTQAHIARVPDEDGIQCPRCGHYKISHSLLPQVSELSKRERERVSGWIRSQYTSGIIPDIHTGNFSEIKNATPPSLNDRLDALLALLVERSTALGSLVNTNSPDLLAHTWVDNQGELNFLIQTLAEMGRLKYQSLGNNAVILPDGLRRYEKLKEPNQDSPHGFVAMWFSESLKDVFEGAFKSAIENTGYSVLRGDTGEYLDKIDDTILARIKRARFVVADFTGQRQNVYFEAGYAMGLGLPVIWTCRSDEIDSLHFDVRQYNCLQWSNPEELREKLESRITVNIGSRARGQ